MGGVISPGELVCFPSPSRRLRHPRGLGSGLGGAAGPRGGGEGMSTWLPPQAARHLVSALEPHCRELGVSQRVPPSPARLGAPGWEGRYGLLQSTLLRALEDFFFSPPALVCSAFRQRMVKDLLDVREVCSLPMA